VHSGRRRPRPVTFRSSRRIISCYRSLGGNEYLNRRRYLTISACFDILFSQVDRTSGYRLNLHSPTPLSSLKSKASSISPHSFIQSTYQSYMLSYLYGWHNRRCRDTMSHFLRLWPWGYREAYNVGLNSMAIHTHCLA